MEEEGSSAGLRSDPASADISEASESPAPLGGALSGAPPTCETKGQGGGRITWIERLGPNSTLGPDDRQWILCREGHAVSFVRSTKAILARCIRETGVEVSLEGKAALDALADDFDSWKADPAQR